MKEIRLFYHGPNKGKVNFGDALSPILVSEITGRKVIYSSIFRCDLIAIGSILDTYFRWRMVRSLIGQFNDTLVWGSGFIKEGPDRVPKGLAIAAVRGPKTRRRLGLSPDTPLGDPGLLVSRIIQKSAVPRYSWGIIPHLADAQDARIDLLLAATKHSTLIRIDQDPTQTLKKISECEQIVSSSLHGLIVADALNIPNWWIKLGDRLIGGSWKFDDYFGSVRRTNAEPAMIPQYGDMDSAMLIGDFSYWENIPLICRNLGESIGNFF